MAGGTLEDFLGEVPCPALRGVLRAVAAGSAAVAALARDGGAGAAGAANAFGDVQLDLDLAADAAILRALRGASGVAMVASEENPFEQALHPAGAYSVAFDPLDGSSVAPCNWAVGSIFGVWRGRGLARARGADMAGAAVAVHGPRATLWVAAAGASGAREFTLRGGAWLASARCDAVRGDVRVFAPANLRAAQAHVGYARLVDHYVRARYTLRYSGALVPDVAQILVRGGGVFVSPTAPEAPPKLRALYEVMPVAFLAEKAGAQAVDHAGRRVLEQAADGCDARMGLCVGAREEVQRFVDMCCERPAGEERVREVGMGC